MKEPGKRFLLPVLICLYGMNFMDRSVLSVVGDALKADMNLSDAQLGLLHSLLLIMLIFFMLPCAALCDTVGRKRMITIAGAIWSGAMALTGAATSFAQLAIARCLGSVNESIVSPGGNSWLASIYPPNSRGGVLGAFQTSSPLGMALGMLLGGAILSCTGNWRLCFYIFVIPGIVCTCLIPFLPSRQTPSGPGYLKDLPSLLRNKAVIVGGVGTGFYCIAKFAYQAWLPVLLLRSYENLTPVTSGAMCGAFLLAGAIGPFLGGSFSDWYNRRTSSGRIYAIMICFALLVVSKLVLYGLIGIAPLHVIVGIGLIDGVITMLPLPIYFAIIQDVVEDRYRGAVCGVAGVIVFLTGGAWGPLLVGIISDWLGGAAGSLRLAELYLLVFPCLSIAFFALITKSYCRSRKVAAESA